MTLQVARAVYLILHAAGIVDHAHPGGAGSHVQALDDVGQEDLDLLELGGADAAAAVHDEHQVGGPRVAQAGRWARVEVEVEEEEGGAESRDYLCNIICILPK